MTFHQSAHLLLLLCLAIIPPGCGQKGDLYLSDAKTDQTQTDEQSSSKK